MTDGEGKFVLEGLDAELLFELLVAAPGYKPVYTEGHVDPRDGALTLALEARDLEQRAPEFVLRGRVLDEHGEPIRRATVTPFATKTKRGVRYGPVECDPLAVTDEQGAFVLSLDEPGLVIQARVGASAFAARISPWLAAGAEDLVVTLTRGVTVTGRVEQDGKPVEGLLMGLAQQDHDAAVWLGEYMIGTDPGGRFTFVNVAPGQAFSLYGKAFSCASRGAISVRALTLGADGSTLDVGAVPLEPGLRLTGRVVVSDGSALPSGTQLLLSREEAFDSYSTTVAADGTFRFERLPRELVALSPALRTYRVSPLNESHDFLNDSGLLGRLDADTELELLLEPAAGPMGPPSFDGLDGGAWERYLELQRSPLRGRPFAGAPAPR